MPDNGYASLAGELLGQGHDTLILDYGTSDLISRLMPRSVSKRILPAVQAVFDTISRGESPSSEEVRALTALDRELFEIHDREVLKIAGEISETVRREKPDFVGFKLWNGDGFSGSIRIAKILKERFPSLKVFAGGPHVDMFKGLILDRTDAFDAISFGEGEETILELAEYAEGKRPLDGIHNILYREEGKVVETGVKRVEDLDSLAYPVYDEEIYPAMAGDQKLKIVVVDESRGCPCCCHFCIQPIKSGTKVRMKSPKRVVEEMRRVSGANGTRLFRYAGSATPPVLARGIAEEIIRTGLDVEYTAFGNLLGAKPEDYDLLKKSGCYSIFFGVESGSREILKRSFGKPRDPKRMAGILKAAKAAGIYTVASVIYPAPFETEETTRETIELLLDARPDSVPVQFSAVYPQTRWAQTPGEFGFKFSTADWQERLLEYKIKLLFPPTLWEPLPYTIDGKPFEKFALETFRLISILERNGILTAISDDQALMAKYAGYRGREKEFRELARKWFMAGETEAIAEMVERINSNQRSESITA